MCVQRNKSISSEAEWSDSGEISHISDTVVINKVSKRKNPARACKRYIDYAE